MRETAVPILPKPSRSQSTSPHTAIFATTPMSNYKQRASFEVSAPLPHAHPGADIRSYPCILSLVSQKLRRAPHPSIVASWSALPTPPGRWSKTPLFKRRLTSRPVRLNNEHPQSQGSRRSTVPCNVPCPRSFFQSALIHEAG